MQPPVLRQTSLSVPKISFGSVAENNNGTVVGGIATPDSDDSVSLYSVENDNEQQQQNDEDKIIAACSMPQALLELKQQLPLVAADCDTDRVVVLDNVFFWRLRTYQARPQTRDWRRRDNAISCRQLAHSIARLLTQVRVASCIVAHDQLVRSSSVDLTNKERHQSTGALLAYEIQDWLLQLLQLMPVWLALQMQKGTLEREVEFDAAVAAVARVRTALKEVERTAEQELTRLRAQDEIRLKAIQRSLGLCGYSAANNTNSHGHHSIHHGNSSTSSMIMSRKRSHRLSGALLHASLLAYRPEVRRASRRRQTAAAAAIQQQHQNSQLLLFLPKIMTLYKIIASLVLSSQFWLCCVLLLCASCGGFLFGLLAWPL